MFQSLKLGKLFGIDLFVHPTFWLLPIFYFLGGVLAGDFVGAVIDVAVIFAVFVCIALHEVGHALAAAYYGIQTRHITLYPMGGVAALERMPERPLHEIVVALAGPAVNVMIALGLLAGLVIGNVALPGSMALDGLSLLDQFVIRLLAINVFLVVFNLLPAFPMDGGRVFRAMLHSVLPRADATRVAVGVGSVIAIGFVLVGLGIAQSVVPLPQPFAKGNVGLVLVGAVVLLLGRAELAQVRAVEARRTWERRNGWVEADIPVAEVIRPPRFTGWKFDPDRRVWSEWVDGVVVREVEVV
jgi:Zn-dependent protease